MLGYRFYREYQDGPNGGKKSGSPKDSIIAVTLHRFARGWTENTLPNAYPLAYEAFVGLHDEPNPPVCYGQVSYSYLQRRCKRVSEKEARAAHPKLFERLDQE